MSLDNIKSLDRNDFLNMLGLETKRTNVDYLVPGLTLFGVGVLVGTGLGLLVAQRPGRELREDIANRIQHAPEAMARLPQRANEAMHRMTDTVSDKLHQGADRVGQGADRLHQGADRLHTDGKTGV